MKTIIEPVITYINTRLDDLALGAAIIALQSNPPINDDQNAVFMAFQRYSDRITTYGDLKEYLRSMSDEQLVGVAANVKGILHEMEFVRMENADGDQFSAVLFPETNYKDYDVVVTDALTDNVVHIQLKATDNIAYVEEWLATHPDGEILVTEEIAGEMGLPSSGLSNEELTVKVDDFIETIIHTPTNSDIWQYFPQLTLLSISHAIFILYRKYKVGEISGKQFKGYSALMAGIKASKITMLMVLLSLPIISQITGTLMIAGIIMSAQEYARGSKRLGRRSVNAIALGQSLISNK